MTAAAPSSSPKTVELEAALISRLGQAAARGCASSEHAMAVQILRALGRHREAIALLDEAATMRPGAAEDSEALGFVAFEAGAHDRSREYYAKVVEAKPRDALAWYNLATAERNVGRLCEAEEASDRALALSPTMAEAALFRSQLRTQTSASNHIDALRSMLAKTSAIRGADVFLNYALGKEYDDLGDYDRAFGHFDSGARARRQMLDYHVGQDIAKLQRIAESFDRHRLNDAPPLAAPAYGFIVGLPRSGTTMIERILTGSPLARTNGETDNLFAALAEGAAVSGEDVFERVARADRDLVEAAYARRAGGRPSGEVVLEKLPLNYLYLGAVRLTLPNARVLLVNRTPADNCFAMFSTLFGGGYPFSYNFDDLAGYYVAYHRLMAHWRMTIGDQLVEAKYEDVVADPLGEGRRIASHMGIEWFDDMALIERNKTASATASAAQVRRPIYTTAAGRWRNYARYLAPLIRTLEAAGIDPGRY